jgi:hypothetical protein
VTARPGDGENDPHEHLPGCRPSDGAV